MVKHHLHRLNCILHRAHPVLWLVCFLIAGTETNAEKLLHYDQPRKLCDLEKEDIIESSGLASSNLDADRFWTHNDSGDKSRLFAFNREGRHLGTCRIDGAKFDDWEDMAAAVIDGRAMLIIGDVGDNRRTRKSCTIYFIIEPINPKDDVKLLSKLKFEYEDGPVDCEAIAYDPRNRHILLTEKTRLGSFSRGRVYQLPIPDEVLAGKKQTSKRLIASIIGTTYVPSVTAMDVSRDGRFMVIGSYVESNLYERRLGETWKDALMRRGQIVHMPKRRQGETICFANSSYNLFATSEKRPTPFFEIRAMED